MTDTSSSGSALRKCVSPAGAWALSFGCAVGWGAFMMPGTTFLPLAGPVGCAIGMLIGGLVMILIGVNYHYMMNRCPDCGGTFAYSRSEFGYDQGFLCSWFLLLVYVAIVWANASAISLLCRYLLKDILEFGPHYHIAGFDVYLTECLIAVAVVLAVGFICTLGGRISSLIQTILAVILIGGVILCASVIAARSGLRISAVSPAYAPDGGFQGLQILHIVALSPWAYVGFESISHSTEEFRFSPRRTIYVFIAAILTGVAAYSLLSFIAASSQPAGYTDWFSYVKDLDNLSGRDGLPTFHAVSEYMGTKGMIILGLSVSAAILTGLTGNMTAAARLLYSMSRDRIYPGWFSHTNRHGVPHKAILFLALLSLPIPFLGRTAISWIVDVNTIGATLVYVYTSLSAYRRASRENNEGMKIAGAAGTLIAAVFTLYFLIPNFWSVEALSSESYLIMILWSILGFVVFYVIMHRDKLNRFGKSTVVWMVLLFAMFYVSLLWYRETTHGIAEEALNDLNRYESQILNDHDISLNSSEQSKANDHLAGVITEVRSDMWRISFIQMLIIMIALYILFKIFVTIIKRQNEADLKRITAEQSSRAKTTLLSNVSHDIRSPINAIIGYTQITSDIKDLPPEARHNLDSIGYSSRYLLSLINDVLDMGQIESGKMTLDTETADLVRLTQEAGAMFKTQMDEKHMSFSVICDSINDRYVICDTGRLTRILLNLISNALKYTPDGGEVTVSAIQRGSDPQKGHYEFRVRDNGDGMSPEFAATVFDAYTREDTASRIQGTGLGMSITKSLVDLMGGTIRVDTKKGHGSEFILELDFELTDKDAYLKEHATEASDAEKDYTGKTVLLVEDQPVNMEIEKKLLEKYGFTVHTAENGRIAFDMIRSSAPGTYDLMLMDIQMPEMNGYETAAAIRAIPDPDLASVPIIAMTANAWSEDISKAYDAGMNGHVAKPIEINKMLDSISEVLADD